MKVCSVCNEIVSGNQNCGRSNCPAPKGKSSALSQKPEPGFTGRADKAVQSGLDEVGQQARVVTRATVLALTGATIIGCLGFLTYKLVEDTGSPWDYSKIELDVGPDGIISELDDSKMNSMGFNGIEFVTVAPMKSTELGTYGDEQSAVHGEFILSQSSDCEGLSYKINSRKWIATENDVIDSREIKYADHTLGVRFRLNPQSDVILEVTNPGSNSCKFYLINRKLSSTQWMQDEDSAKAEMGKLAKISKASIAWTYSAEGLEERLSSAYDVRGEAAFAKCAACHTIDPGGMDGIGPNLYGVVGRDIASKGGFVYTSVLSSKAGEWDFAKLDRWLARPKLFAPGTKMSFAGLSNPQERADIIVYLNLQGSLKPLPSNLPK
jgi:cytochrome c2